MTVKVKITGIDTLKEYNDVDAVTGISNIAIVINSKGNVTQLALDSIDYYTVER